MNKIETLLSKALGLKERHNGNIYQAFISSGDDGLYTLSCKLWNGVPGTGWEAKSRHNSIEEAEAHIETVAAEYPLSKGFVCFLDDL